MRLESELAQLRAGFIPPEANRGTAGLHPAVHPPHSASGKPRWSVIRRVPSVDGTLRTVSVDTDMIKR